MGSEYSDPTKPKRVGLGVVLLRSRACRESTVLSVVSLGHAVLMGQGAHFFFTIVCLTLLPFICLELLDYSRSLFGLYCGHTGLVRCACPLGLCPCALSLYLGYFVLGTFMLPNNNCMSSHSTRGSAIPPPFARERSTLKPLQNLRRMAAVIVQPRTSQPYQRQCAILT